MNILLFLLKDDTYLDREIRECLETILYKIDYEEHHMTFEFQEGKQEMNRRTGKIRLCWNV